MVRVAIVEDEEKAYNDLKGALDRFTAETGVEFFSTAFKDAVAFLDDYKGNYDIVFMDIQMPYLNGMRAAEKLREIDDKVILIFVTNLTQYAVNGYAVKAKDYILKPVQYNRFECMLRRVLSDEYIESPDDLFIKNGTSLYRFRLSAVRYIEIKDHSILYHMDDKDVSSWGTMKELESKLADKGFCRLDKSTIVNLRYVSEIEDDQVFLFNGEKFYISRPRKKEVKEAFAAYMEGKLQ